MHTRLLPIALLFLAPAAARAQTIVSAGFGHSPRLFETGKKSAIAITTLTFCEGLGCPFFVDYAIVGASAGVTACFNDPAPGEACQTAAGAPPGAATIIHVDVAADAPIGAGVIAVNARAIATSGSFFDSATHSFQVVPPVLTPPGEVAVIAGRSTVATIPIQRSAVLVGKPITVRAAGLPFGVTASAPAATTGSSVTITFSVSTSAVALSSDDVVLTAAIPDFDAFLVTPQPFVIEDPFTLTLAQTLVQTVPGRALSIPLAVVQHQGLSDPIALTVSTTPGISASLGGSGSARTLDLVVGSGVTPGMRAIIVSGTSAGVTRSARLNLNVRALNLVYDPTMETLGNLPVSQTLTLERGPQTATASVSFGLEVPRTPIGVPLFSGAFNPPATTGSSTTLQVKPTLGTPSGRYHLTIRATANGVTESFPLDIVVGLTPSL